SIQCIDEAVYFVVAVEQVERREVGGYRIRLKLDDGLLPHFEATIRFVNQTHIEQVVVSSAILLNQRIGLPFADLQRAAPLFDQGRQLFQECLFGHRVDTVEYFLFQVLGDDKVFIKRCDLIGVQLVACQFIIVLEKQRDVDELFVACPQQLVRFDGPVDVLGELV